MSDIDCFVIMPFAKEFDPVYKKAIRSGARRAAKALGGSISVTRVDDYESPSQITRDIIERICRSDCVVADLTGGNANVFYELGVAHAMGDKTVMLTQDLDRLPFDLKSYRVLAYSLKGDGLAKLGTKLAASLTSILEREPGKPSPRSNPVSDFAPVRLTDVTVSLNEVRALEKRTTEEIWILGPDVDIDIRDYSSTMKEGILKRSLVYKYILPDTTHAKRSWLRLEQALDLPSAHRANLQHKLVPEHVIESELVIYCPRGRGEAVFLIPPAEDHENIYIRLPPTRAAAIRRRFERLWDE